MAGFPDSDAEEHWVANCDFTIRGTEDMSADDHLHREIDRAIAAGQTDLARSLVELREQQYRPEPIPAVEEPVDTFECALGPKRSKRSTAVKK